MEASNEKAVSPLTLVAVFGIASVLFVIVRTIVDVYRGPLSHIPGPKINAFSYIPYVRDMLKGTPVDTTVDLHRQYGEVVRLSPTEVSFTSASTAYPDIYGFRTGKLRGHPNMNKDDKWYAVPPGVAPSILAADDEAHSRGRKVLSHAFSERSLNAQEPLVQSYVDKLITRLQEVTSKDPQPLDIVRWYNWTAFDVIADLMFGEPFGCLDDLSTHQYVELLFSSLQAQVYNALPKYIPVLKYVIPWVVDKNVLGKRREFLAWTEEQVRKRTARDTDRPDFMTDILANNGHKGAQLSDKEIHSNAGLILIAGSETTATLLSGATYLLLQNPTTYEKLKREVRAAFDSQDAITLEAVNRLPYLLAVLSEALRVFPPVPVGFVRKVGRGGELVSGHYIPEGTSLSVSQYAANHSEENFHDASAFVPERWLDDADAKYADDKKSGLQPFSFGPRSCLGRNLAYAEMRLILAKMVWSFDLELQAQSRDWLARCRVKRLWVKPELMVKVTEAVRA